MASIALRQLSKRYPNGVLAVDALDLTIADGEFFALLGPSGCGKTTLLRTIAGLESSTGGAVLLGDRDVTHLPPGKRDVAMVFQDYALFPHMDVADNIAYPLRISEVGQSGAPVKAAETGAGLGLDALMDRRPGAALRRPAAAGRAGPGDRVPAGGVPASTSRCRTSTPDSGWRRGRF